MLLIQIVCSDKLFRFLLQAPSLGSLCPFFGFLLSLLWVPSVPYLDLYGSLGFVRPYSMSYSGHRGLNDIQSCFISRETLEDHWFVKNLEKNIWLV